MNGTSLIARIAVAAPLDKTLSYLVPDELRDRIKIGLRVRVPLGRRLVVGFLLELESGEGTGLKPIREILDDVPLFLPGMIPFFRWAAGYYRHPLGEVIRTALPAGLSGRGTEPVILRDRLFHPTDRTEEPRATRQGEILAFVRANGATTLSEIRARFPNPYAPLKRLVELGLMRDEEIERRRDPFANVPVRPDEPPTPTPEQAEILDRVEASLRGNAFDSILLHGVTGSGKTEIYLRAIGAALALGRSALVLVPEISLTPQLVQRFRSRFTAPEVAIAILHSGLSDGERFDAWRDIARGKARIVIGVRSAVFAPLGDLGIVVVDEEHGSSYKQAEGFRYHARDLALLRGRMAGATVLLGSATPALTSYHRARTGRMTYLPLPERVRNRPMPQVEIVDMTHHEGTGPLSEELLGRLAATLEQKEQALLLLNRRGFSPFLLCTDCGAVFRCPNCAITLTYHRERGRLLCHYCDYAIAPPAHCPGCGGHSLQPEGVGTERLEEELTGLFPAARMARLDRDTTSRKGAHQRIYEKMVAGEVDILVGTQMVAKGHDFPGVTLVGVVNADTTLNFPDFRSAERTFALLSQVAGRAGRGDTPGRVVIQTYAPDHFAVTCAAEHAYDEFYRQEIAFRESLGYPPFGYLVNLVFSGNDRSATEAAAEKTARALNAANRGVEVLGPAPCPLARLRGKFRMQILLKSPDRPRLHRLLDALPNLRRGIPSTVALAIDVDPEDML